MTEEETMTILKMGGGSMDLPTAKVGETTVVLLGDLVKSNRFLKLTDVHIPSAYMAAFLKAFNGSNLEYVINWVLGNCISEEDAQKEMSRCMEFSILKAFDSLDAKERHVLTNKDAAIIANNVYKKMVLSDERLKQEIANKLVDKLYKILQEGNSIACGGGVLQMKNDEIWLRDVVDNVYNEFAVI